MGPFKQEQDEKPSREFLVVTAISVEAFHESRVGLQRQIWLKLRFFGSERCQIPHFNHMAFWGGPADTHVPVRNFLPEPLRDGASGFFASL